MSLKNIASNQVFRIQRVFEISKEIIADSYFKQVQVPLFRIVSGAISSELALPFFTFYSNTVPTYQVFSSGFFSFILLS